MNQADPCEANATERNEKPESYLDGEASRGLHPLSLLFEVARRIRENIIPAIFASFSAVTGGVIGLYIACGIFGIAITFALIRYWTFRYRLTASELTVDQGLVFKSHRSIPIHRIQNIDSVQNLFHRFFRVAEVRIETASGNEPEAIMRVLSVSEIERLKQRLNDFSKSTSVRMNKADPAAAPTGTVPFEEQTAVLATTDAMPAATAHAGTSEPTGSDEVILRIPLSRLVLAGLLSNRGQILAGLAFGYLWQMQFSGYLPDWDPKDLAKETNKESLRSGARSIFRGMMNWQETWNWIQEKGGVAGTVLFVIVAVLLLVLILRVFSAIWYVLKFYDYQLTKRGGDLQIRCGLFTRIAATVPRARIQVVCVHRSWLAKFFGMAAVRIESAGGGSVETQDASASIVRQWFVPIVSVRDLPNILDVVQPGLVWDSPQTNWKPMARRTFQRMIRLPLAVCLLMLLSGVALGSGFGWKWGIPLVSLSILGSIATIVVSRKKSKSRKFARTDLGIVYRSGVLMQKTSFAFFDRLQSVQWSQSPFDRRWNMANLLFDTSGAGTAEHTLLVEFLDDEVASEEYEKFVN